MSETCWAHKKWNKIASDIRLVLYSSTIAMIDGPINIRFVINMFIVWVVQIKRTIWKKVVEARAANYGNKNRDTLNAYKSAHMTTCYFTEQNTCIVVDWVTHYEKYCSFLYSCHLHFVSVCRLADSFFFLGSPIALSDFSISANFITLLFLKCVFPVVFLK